MPSLGNLKILRLQVKYRCLEISDLLFLSRAKTCCFVLKKYGRSLISYRFYYYTYQVKVKCKAKNKNYTLKKPGRGRLSRHKKLVS
jgi:hypothetical protein